MAQFKDNRGSDEMFWVQHYELLLHRGYQLRPRYSPAWVPSWVVDRSKSLLFCEDSVIPFYAFAVMDATQVSDGRKVVLKRVNTKSRELIVLQHLSQPALQSDPRCHSIPLLDAIPLPSDDEIAIAVIPLLMHISHLPFRRVGEIAEALEQLFEGVAFLHEHDIIHGDACFFNFLFDATKMVPDGWHFAAEYFQDDVLTRIKWTDRWLTRPNKYFLVDYDLSVHVKADEDRWMTGFWGQDGTVPEMRGHEPCDGFKVDVYQMANVINDLIERYTGLEEFKLIADKLMVPDPRKRPSACSAVHLLRYFIKNLPKSTLSRWIWEKEGPGKLNWQTKIRVQYFGATSVLRSL